MIQLVSGTAYHDGENFYALSLLASGYQGLFSWG